ncbi:DUF4097 family beta strand repeat protein [Rubrobacter tropicus]|uniref:DUF4097 family beta strand repeat protein n=1 Tax=Rubrobacter tropicus TaxID=2653851 RepID=A0A6G8QEF5_9ACTN|nr:DUF4097 family beta strand repeat-containing protein [Rubrobacter tropicus]QIN84884.1 DUF4097 family beta strand repeat protein [Rubrobacter tropicus]
MGASGRGGPRRPGREGPQNRPPNRTRRSGESPAGPNLLTVVAALLVLALLVVVAVFLWRTLGDEVPGSSVAEDSIDSGREPKVEITNGPGSVTVEGAEGSEAVEYEVTRYAVAGDPAAARSAASEVPVNVAREGSTVTLETNGGGETGADYSVVVPAGGGVEVESEEGDVEVSGVDGAVTVRAASGDVAVRDVAGDITVEAEMGDVVVGGIRTDTGNVELAVESGDVALEDLIVGTLEATVETGDVTLSGRFSGDGRVSVGTGDVTARLPSDDVTDLSLETLVGKVSRDTPDENARPENRKGGNE